MKKLSINYLKLKYIIINFLFLFLISNGAIANKISFEISGNKFSEVALQEKGVALVPGSSFGDNASEFVRISFANSLENIKEAIKRLSTI